jgi:hypothetical protein
MTFNVFGPDSAAEPAADARATHRTTADRHIRITLSKRLPQNRTIPPGRPADNRKTVKIAAGRVAGIGFAPVDLPGPIPALTTFLLIT